MTLPQKLLLMACSLLPLATPCALWLTWRTVRLPGVITAAEFETWECDGFRRRYFVWINYSNGTKTRKLQNGEEECSAKTAAAKFKCGKAEYENAASGTPVTVLIHYNAVGCKIGESFTREANH